MAEVTLLHFHGSFFRSLNTSAMAASSVPLQRRLHYFDLSPVDMVLFNDLKMAKAELKKAMKAFRKREKVQDKM